jgi:hypothetical protein
MALAGGGQRAIAQATPRGLSTEIVTGPVKIRPYDPLPAPVNLPLHCAKNEYCSFQLVLTADGEDREGLNVDATELVGPGKTIIPSSQITIYREDFLNVFYVSDVQGKTGEWPDPLIPKVDPEYKEQRNAFPFAIHRISKAYKKYLLTRDHTQGRPDGRGAGQAISGGSYRGNRAKQYTIKIVKPGTLGVATFQWTAQPGGGVSKEFPVLGTLTPLDDGVTVAFRSGGRGTQDFLAGDEFWIFAGPSRHQPVWVDILIPPNALPGLYVGKVRITENGQPLKEIPLRLDVWNFSIPSTSSLPNFFGMYWHGLYRCHYGGGWDGTAIRTLGQLYAKAALRNSITVGDSNFPPPYKFNADGTVAQADYTDYDAAVGPLMDGLGTPRGARWTSLQLPHFSDVNSAQAVHQLRHFIEHVKQRGWYDRLFDYTIDEPNTPENFRELERRARLVMAADPKVPRLVTTVLSDRRIELVTRWCPVVNYLDPRPLPWDAPKYPSRADYEPRLKQGDQLWWYQSCMSHGCGIVGGPPEYGDWPSYMVDASGVANRVFGLLTAVTFRIQGILYWDVAFALFHYADQQGGKLDVWDSVYYFGGNGDGTLFYPGRPEQVGGKHHIPIESLRLKMIRDSFYDAEYAYKLRALGEEQFLQQEVSRVVQKAYQWNPDPQAWNSLRNALGERIQQASAARRAK